MKMTDEQIDAMVVELASLERPAGTIMADSRRIVRKHIARAVHAQECMEQRLHVDSRMAAEKVSDG